MNCVAWEGRCTELPPARGEPRERAWQMRGRGHGALRNEADSSDHAGRLLGTSLAAHTEIKYKRGFLWKAIGKKMENDGNNGKTRKQISTPKK